METMTSALHTHKAAIAPIQALRGMAACLVVVVHLLERLTKRGAFPQALPEWVWSCGHIGVGVFFAISGFIMVYTTGDEFARAGAGRRFFLRRFLRVAPIYYLTSALMIAFSYVTFRYSTNAVYPVPTPSLTLMSVLFVPYMDYKGLTLPVYELGWTLNYEMFFYAAFAVALMAPRRIGLAAVMAALTALVLVGTLVPAPAMVVGMPVPLFFFTRPVMLYFVIGMVMGAVRLRFGALRLPVAEAALCLMMLIPLALAVRFGAQEITLIGALCVALVLALASLLEGSRTHSAFATIAKAFGDASYSMYLTHSFLLGVLGVVLTRVAAGHTGLLCMLIALACLICAGAAWLVWRFVERPLTTWLGRRLTTAAVPEQAVAAP